MKYIAAYALLVLGGKESPSAADIEKLLKEAGVKAESDKAQNVVAALEGKKLHEVISAGKDKMQSAGPAPAGAPAQAAPAGNAKPAAKVEEKPKEEEADVDMGGLFGDDY